MPFDIVVDPQNRVWVSNSQSDTVVRFPADDPSKVESFHAGIVVRALALDSKPMSGWRATCRWTFRSRRCRRPAGFTGGGAVDIPWGLNIDGND